MVDLEHRSIQIVKISDLKPAPRNARTHSKRQIRQIADSIIRFGFTNAILIDESFGIVAGHGRVAAAKEIGITEVPYVLLSKMSAADKRAYIIADNKLALSAGWDMEILAGELQGLMELGFEMELTGFDLPEIDIILNEVELSSTACVQPADYHPEPLAQAVTRSGDLWKLGGHALLCADAKDRAAVDKLMAGRKADMIFCDPPYNLKIDGHVSGLGRIQHREFAEASGEMSKEEFTEFLRQTLGNAAAVCKDGAIADVCMDWRHFGEALAAGHDVFSELKNMCVWAKTNGGMGTFYRSKHELVLVWKIGTAPHTNTFGLGDKGRYRTNVWDYPGVNTFKSERMDELALHPTVKPVALVADAIRGVSHRGELILDVFGGSGTTLIAAQKTGRIARLIELDPIYCDVIIRRWERLTGKHALLSSTGNTYEVERDTRLGSAAVLPMGQAA